MCDLLELQSYIVFEVVIVVAELLLELSVLKRHAKRAIIRVIVLVKDDLLLLHELTTNIYFILLMRYSPLANSRILKTDHSPHISSIMQQSFLADKPYFEAKKFTQGLTDKQSDRTLSQLDKIKMSIGVPDIQEETELKDLFSCLKRLDNFEAAYNQDQNKVKAALEDLDKSGMRFLTYGEVQKQEKLRDLAAERKRMKTKEQDFFGSLRQFFDFYNVNRRLQVQKGEFNKDFENKKRSEGLRLKFIKEQIDNEKRLWLKHLDVALTGAFPPSNSNMFLRKKGADLFKEAESLNLGEIKMMRDKLVQDQYKIQKMKVTFSTIMIRNKVFTMSQPRSKLLKSRK